MRRVVLCNLQPPGPAVFVPYASGSLQAYASQFPDLGWEFGPPVWEWDGDPGEADVVGFSLYLWNTRASERLAARVRERSPGTLIVAGGPQVPPEGVPWADVSVHGEGEEALVRILRGERPRVLQAPRLASLDFPSPYLLGLFDDFARAARGRSLMAGMETNRGCPYSCAFCDWGMATMSKLRQFPAERVRGELEWAAAHGVDGIYLCDANFGILPRDVDFARQVADLRGRHGKPRWFFPLGFAKNHRDRAFEVTRILWEGGLDPHGMNANFSLQAVVQETLDAIGRQAIPVENYRVMARRYEEAGQPLVPDLILPLPGETPASFRAGFGELASWPQVGKIRVYECLVLPNAPMARPEYRERWGLRTRWRPVGTAGEEGEFVVATSTMSEEEVVEARVFVALVTALELSGLLRPLRQRLGLRVEELYARLAATSRVLADPLGTVRAALRRDEALSVAHDGTRMPHAKTIAWAVLDRRDRFLAELEAPPELLRFVADTWVGPEFDPEDPSAYVFTYPAGVVEEAPVRVTYRPRPEWTGWRRGREAARAFALVPSGDRFFCTFDPATKVVERC